MSIVTFYSYKGGVGRTMSLANIATILASKGMDVLIVDWDLEAPGLEEYFEGFKYKQKGQGLLQMLWDINQKRKVDYRKHLWTLEHPETNISLQLLPSGREEESYYSMLEEFNSVEFFNSGGALHLESLRNQWKEDFDFVLIDSRTGLSDAGGICTIQLPDIVVALFTPINQSLYGVRDVMRLAKNGRQRFEFDRMDLTIIPIICRIDEESDNQTKDNIFSQSGEVLAEFFDDWLPARAPIENVLKSFYFPHDPELLHGASLTVDPVGDGYSKISKSYHQIASLLSSNLDVTQTDINLDMNNQEIKTKPSEYSYDIYISYPRGGMTSKWIQDTFLPLLNHSLGMFLGRSATLFFDYSELSAGDEFPVAIEEALRNSKILIALYTPNYFNSNWCVAEHRTFELKEKEFNSSLIVPIVLHNGQMFPEYARVRQWSDFREYFRLGDTFKLTERYSEFEEKVGELSDAISSLIHKVPELKKNFKVIKPSDVKIKRIDGPPLL